MNVMEIVLIILGVVVFIISFLIPAGKKNDAKDDNRISEEAIREIVDRGVEEARSQISDIVDETVTYSMEKTERSMERLANEKIMAVNEYSDTVLAEINKNHKEVIFLYDMLNDKHESLKTTVSEATKTAGEIIQTVRDAEVTAREAEEKAREVQATVSANEEAGGRLKSEDDFVPFAPKRVTVMAEQSEDEKVQKVREETPQKPEAAKKTVRKPRTAKALVKESAPTEVPEIEIALNTAEEGNGRNSNERILELHKAGKSNMAIAKELGLGIGEVKLVIDLFEGI